MRNIFNIFLESVFAGIAISMGCVAFLSVGGVIGAILFTFGLLTVVHYFAKLYTGTAGFVCGFFHKDTMYIILILFGNVVGCAFLAWLISQSGYDFKEPLDKLIQMRESLPIGGVFIRAILCGLIMTAAVKFWRNSQPLVLIFGVPLFILSGYLHSIADAFYYSLDAIYNANISKEILLIWTVTVIGNYVGCNAWRVFNLTK